MQLARGRREVGHALDRRGAGADDADPLVGEVLQLLAGVTVVPAAGVKRPAAIFITYEIRCSSPYEICSSATTIKMR